MSWISGTSSISFGFVISASFGTYSVVIDGKNFPATFVLRGLDHGLAWLDLSKNHIFESSTYTVHRAFVVVSLIIELRNFLLKKKGAS